ncbi:UV excision repair protein RAD23 homolog B-like [Uloborus diversus]|uniref:UV excision repair protein RAD23 homolog B-like n=1 Tax=Uloborus diversus TaxID=327109 RepID=UPI00240A6697|nr:UV excision repair protein RAD23 homolog B-like [Uloborus diversus]
MLVTIKNLHEESFTIETEPWEIVGNLKEQIERIKGPAYAAKDIKLLYAGKFLRDNRRLCDYSIDEKTFIIILLKTPKNEPVEEEMEIPTTPASPRLSPERVVGASDNTIDRCVAVFHVYFG